MEDAVKLLPSRNGRSKFVIIYDAVEIAEMEVGRADNLLTIYHTEVKPEAEGRGLAKTLLSAMKAYSKQQGLKVKPLCPFVYGQFKKYPDLFEDIWYKDE